MSCERQSGQLFSDEIWAEKGNPNMKVNYLSQWAELIVQMMTTTIAEGPPSLRVL